jgi:hypothetical protein
MPEEVAATVIAEDATTATPATTATTGPVDTAGADGTRVPLA